MKRVASYRASLSRRPTETSRTTFLTLPCREGFHADASVERAREMRASLAAAAVLLAVLASSAVGVGADHPRTVSRTPRFKTFARPSRAKAWVPEAHVFANKTRDTDVLDGVLAVDGTYALVVSNDQLPSLAPISSTFTIAMSLFLHDDLNVASIDAHRGIFWKGGASGDRTPSAWLIPHSNRVTYRVSTSSAEEVWGTSAAALPTRRWVHLAFSVGADRIMRLYVDGKLDSAVEIVGEVVANDGPLYLGKDAHLTGINAFIASVQMHAHALEDEVGVLGWAVSLLSSFPRLAVVDAELDFTGADIRPATRRLTPPRRPIPRFCQTPAQRRQNLRGRKRQRWTWKRCCRGWRRRSS